jgi:HSP20 family protein
VSYTRWDPFRDLIALHDQLGQIVGSDAPGWTPPVDLYENAGSFVLTAEVPGLTRQEIDIHAEESRIAIRGERASNQVPCEQFHRIERGHGRFSRTFSLPEPINVAQVTAELKDGLLVVMLPKAEGRVGRHVDVS